VIFEAEAVLGYAQSRTRMEERATEPEPVVQEWTADADQLEGEMVELLAGAA
jgi:hypothetical protein